jgi:hypothetical protein
MAKEKDDEEQQAFRQFQAELIAAIKNIKGLAIKLGRGSPKWHEWMKKAELINREADWPAPRTLTFVTPSRPGEFMVLELKVVTRLSGMGLEMDPDQERRAQEIEEQNQGTIPLTSEEFSAMEAGDASRLYDLAKEPTSNWHHLLVWDADLADELLRFRRMHGTGN